MHRHWSWAGIAILLCAALASAASIRGATASVENIDQSTGVATIQITNLSSQGIAAWDIMVTGVHASGKKDFDEHLKDYGPPIAFQKYGLLDSGASVQLNINLGLRPNDLSCTWTQKLPRQSMPIRPLKLPTRKHSRTKWSRANSWRARCKRL